MGCHPPSILTTTQHNPTVKAPPNQMPATICHLKSAHSNLPTTICHLQFLSSPNVPIYQNTMRADQQPKLSMRTCWVASVSPGLLRFSHTRMRAHLCRTAALRAASSAAAFRAWPTHAPRAAASRRWAASRDTSRFRRRHLEVGFSELRGQGGSRGEREGGAGGVREGGVGAWCRGVWGVW